MIQPIHVPGVGAGKSWNAAYIHSLKAGNDALRGGVPDCLGGGAHRSRWRKLYRPGARAARRLDRRGSRRNRIPICRRASINRGSFLSRWKTYSFTLFVAAVARRGARTLGGHLGLASIESRRGQSSSGPATGHYFGGVFQCNVYSPDSKSCVRCQESSMASMACAAHRSRVWIFFRRRGCVGNGAAAELFRNVASASRRYGPALWFGVSRNWRRVSLEFWFGQPADPDSTAAGRNSRCRTRLPTGAESARKEVASGGRHGSHFCRTAVGLEWRAHTRTTPCAKYGQNRGACQSCQCALIISFRYQSVSVLLRH